jgi:hypothetical protein
MAARAATAAKISARMAATALRAEPSAPTMVQKSAPAAWMARISPSHAHPNSVTGPA